MLPCLLPPSQITPRKIPTDGGRLARDDCIIVFGRFVSDDASLTPPNVYILFHSNRSSSCIGLLCAEKPPGVYIRDEGSPSEGLGSPSSSLVPPSAGDGEGCRRGVELPFPGFKLKLTKRSPLRRRCSHTSSGAFLASRQHPLRLKHAAMYNRVHVNGLHPPFYS